MPTSVIRGTTPPTSVTTPLATLKQLRLTDAGVFLADRRRPGIPLVGTFPFPRADHRLVRIDVSNSAFGHR
jgi:hypothetical protein